MPNHVKSRLKINGTREQIETIIEKYGTNYEATLGRAYDDSIICKNPNETPSYGWFNEKTGVFTRRNKAPILGLPEGWEFEINQAWTRFPDFEKIIPPPDDPTYHEEDGFNDNPNWWYNWNRNNWGTKWNSYSHEKESWNTFTFETAWSGVPHLMLEISKAFPEIEFEYEYADEDTGHNCAKFKFLAGEVTEEFEPEGGSLEAYDLAFSLRPDRKKNYQLIGDKYEWVEDDY